MPERLGRRPPELLLLNGTTPQLHVTAVLSHRLTPDSPLVRLGLEAIQAASGAILVLVEGTDEVTASPLLQMHLYRVDDILEGQIFADLVSEDATGRRLVNLDGLDRTRSLRSHDEIGPGGSWPGTHQ